MFGGGRSPSVRSAARMPRSSGPEWPEDERLRYEKETLGFYITGHPLNKYNDELKLFANATTDTLYQHIDEIVNIGGIVSQMKKSKIKKGPNEGKLMAKFFLDDQAGIGRGGGLLRSLREVHAAGSTTAWRCWSRRR